MLHYATLVRNHERDCSASLLRCCTSDENTWEIMRGTDLLVHHWDAAQLSNMRNPERDWPFTIEMLQKWRKYMRNHERDCSASLVRCCKSGKHMRSHERDWPASLLRCCKIEMQGLPRQGRGLNIKMFAYASIRFQHDKCCFHKSAVKGR